MRRIPFKHILGRFAGLLALACIFALAAQAAPTITISASAVSILGTSQTISITCTLIDPNQTGNLRVSGTGVIPVMQASTVTPGATATVGPIYGNDVILDGFGNLNNTYYKVQVFTVTNGIIASTPSLQNFYAFIGSGTIDLSTATPLAPSFMSGTSGSVIIPGSLTVNGATTLSNFNAQFFVDGTQYSGCAAAVTAAGTTNGTTVTIPGTGPIVSCPLTVPENIVLRNFDRTRDQCNGIAGGALPPCNAENYNYDDGNVMAGRRFEFTTSRQDLNGVSLGSYSLTYLKNATANGSSGADGFSAECNTAGTLVGTFNACQAHEANVSIQSNGGSFAAATAVIGAVGTFQSAATCVIATTCTQVTNVYGIYGYGLRDNSTGAHPTNAYGGYFRAQSYGATRNYSAAFENKALLVFVNSTAAIDAEDSAHVARPFLFVDSSNGANFQAVSATGTFFENSAGGLQFSLVGGRANFSSVPVPNLAGNFDIGTTALPWGNLFLGTAATNNFKFQPAATAAARVISMPDPLGNVNMPYVIASGTATFTTTAAATLTCQTTVTVAATGGLATDAIEIAYASAPTGTTDGLLILSKWMTAGNVNFARCNPTAGSITPTALVLNWRVIR